eukprot:jgi/Chlat1/9168/Chrsp97S00711
MPLPSCGRLHVLLYWPNIVDYLRVALLACVFSVLDRHARPELFVLGYVVFMALDAVDGTLARAFNQVSAFGAFLDVTVDCVARALLWRLAADSALWPTLITCLECTWQPKLEAEFLRKCAGLGDSANGKRLPQCRWCTDCGRLGLPASLAMVDRTPRGCSYIMVGRSDLPWDWTSAGHWTRVCRLYRVGLVFMPEPALPSAMVAELKSLRPAHAVVASGRTGQSFRNLWRYCIKSLPLVFKWPQSALATSTTDKP